METMLQLALLQAVLDLEQVKWLVQVLMQGLECCEPLVLMLARALLLCLPVLVLILMGLKMVLIVLSRGAHWALQLSLEQGPAVDETKQVSDLSF